MDKIVIREYYKNRAGINIGYVKTVKEQINAFNVRSEVKGNVFLKSILSILAISASLSYHNFSL
jgi:hypothetical protein